MVNARTTLTGRRADVDPVAVERASEVPEPRSTRAVCFEEWADVGVYDRADLLPGVELDGPLVVEQPDTTVVIEPGLHLAVDEHSNLIVRA